MLKLNFCKAEPPAVRAEEYRLISIAGSGECACFELPVQSGRLRISGKEYTVKGGRCTVPLSVLADNERCGMLIEDGKRTPVRGFAYKNAALTWDEVSPEEHVALLLLASSLDGRTAALEEQMRKVNELVSGVPLFEFDI